MTVEQHYTDAETNILHIVHINCELVESLDNDRLVVKLLEDGAFMHTDDIITVPNSVVTQ